MKSLSFAALANARNVLVTASRAKPNAFRIIDTSLTRVAGQIRAFCNIFNHGHLGVNVSFLGCSISTPSLDAQNLQG
jgi:hypothetical protein